jgi:hypothetical protein
VPFDEAPPECDIVPTGLGEVITDCATALGYTVATYEAEQTCDTGLYVGAIYTTDAGEGGTATVTFDVPGEHVLALSAYEATTWQVTVGPSTTLRAILVAGHGPQTVVGAEVPVVQVPGPPCGYSLPYNGQGCDTDALLDALQTAAGLPVSRFDGCYQASTFSWRP